MTGRATKLPVLMVIVICLLAAIAIASGRSDEPDVAVNMDYPHYICTFNDYCEGDSCSREGASFVIYTAYEDGNPRLDLDGFSPRLRIVENGNSQTFQSTGGDVSGTFAIYSDRAFDFDGTSGESDALVEHFGAGKCERLHTP